jgi:hypothetical protein
MDKWSDPEVMDQVRDWYQGLDEKSAEAFEMALQVLGTDGPATRRPLVGEIDLRSYSAEIRGLFPHLKELRPLGTSQRVLFTFGPDRTLVLLYAGDKAGDWNRWYAPAIKAAAKAYRAYLEE